jgi:pimeloyl-ACP methyl ester carboxylesterase
VNLAHHEFAGPADAPVLLLLHGVTRVWSDWESLIPELARDWRVVAVDHSGHGDSPRTPGEYLVADYARHTVAFLRRKFTRPVAVAGHSLGAMVALSLAAECGPQIVRAILEDPPFHTMGRDIATTPYRRQFVGMQEVARRGGTVAEMAAALAEVRIDARTRLGDIRDRTSLEFSARCLARVDPEVFTPLAAGHWLDGFDHESLLPRVHCPLLLLQGDPAVGGAFTDADVALAKRAQPNAAHVRFIGTGHQIHRTRPTEFLRALRDWSRAPVAN